MPGRGDNNKHGSAGRGSSNQSNQGFGHGQPASNHNKKRTGTKPSTGSPKTADVAANRNISLKDSKQKRD
jgi:hypothetical protein